MRITPKTYLHGFAFVVMALGFARLTTDVEHFQWPTFTAEADSLDDGDKIERIENIETSKSQNLEVSTVSMPAGFIPHPILSVANYDTAFPDPNDVQLVAAKKHGVKPVANRADAEKRMDELVYIGSSPYVELDRLSQSIPYLVPRASVLMHDIGRIYFDSLAVKGVPLHKILATSVLRTKADIEKLRRVNVNATENSCHQYGTTFDLAQNRFKTVSDPDGPQRREVTNDTLKWVLAEVLRDLRNQGRCYVKYERKQGCFHVTVR